MKLDKTCGKCLQCFKKDSGDYITKYECRDGLQVKLDEIGYPVVITDCFKWKSRYIGADKDGDKEIISSAI